MEKSPIGVWITDTHLSENTIEVNFSVFEQAFYICEQLEISTIFHGGDIFTSRKGQPEIVLNAFKKILDIAAEKNIKIVAIAGNHDKVSYPSQSSILDAFDGHKAFSVVSPYGSLVMGEGDTVVHFLPYYDEGLTYNDVLTELLQGLDTQHTNILLTHIGIDGIKNNGGGSVENEIKQDLFDDFKLVLVGHYHNRQIVGKNNHIVYTGSAYQANFGEDENKGCTIIYDDASYEFIDLEFPRYVTLEVLAEDLSKETLKALEYAVEGGDERKFRFKIVGEIEESKKEVIVGLQVYAKVEIIKGDYKPLDVIQRESVTIGDMISEFNEWGEAREIADLDYGRGVLNSRL